MKRKQKKKTCGIYSIRCTKNNKVYIGSAIDIDIRWRFHKSNLRNRSHNNKLLQRDWNKYGGNKFKWRKLFKCAKNDLSFFEQDYLDNPYYKTRLYNVLKVADRNSFGADGQLFEAHRTKAFAEKMKIIALKRESNPVFIKNRKKHNRSKEYKLSMVEGARKRVNDLSTRKKLEKYWKSKICSNIARQNGKKAWKNAETKLRMLSSMHKMWKSKSFKSKASQHSKNLWKNNRSKMIKGRWPKSKAA